MADPTQSVVPSRTYVYLAPVGTASPTLATGVITGFKSVGLTTTDSLGFSTEPEFEEMTSAQSDFPTRRFQTTDAATVSVDLQAWNGRNMKAVYGGGEIVAVMSSDATPVPTGTFKFTPPRTGDREEISAVVEVIDGAKHYRYVFPRTFQVEGVESELHKGAVSNLPLRLAVNGGDAVDAWFLLTDDPAFDPAGEFASFATA